MEINYSDQPLGRLFSIISKTYLSQLNLKLNMLDIERNYYALLLIDMEDGQITQQELACKLEIDKVSMLRSIDYLAENGYVERLKNKSDRRKYSLTLTEKAREALPQIKKSFIELNKTALKGLTEQEISHFYSVLNIIKNNLNEYKSSL